MSPSRLSAVVAVLVACLLAPSAAVAFSHGSAVPARSAPWLVHHVCSAVLVAPARVLTAAHCAGPQGGFVRIGAGPRATETIAVEGVTLHPRYADWVNPRSPSDPASGAGRYDVAILTLARPAAARPLPVAARPARAGTRAIGYGYGRSDTARRAPQDVLPDRRCRSAFPAGAFAAPVTICAGDRGPGVRAHVCSGDSGGPLVAHGRLVGLVTFAGEILGERCGAGPPLAGYVDIGALHAFVAQPRPAFLPVFTRSARVVRDGDVLRCEPPDFAPGATITSTRYSWSARDLRTGHFAYAAIPGRRGRTYALRRADAGTQIRCEQRILTPGGPLFQATEPVRVAAGPAQAASARGGTTSP